MKYLLSVVAVSFLAFAGTKAPSKKDIFIEVAGQGRAQIRHEVPGEPIAAPERLTISIKCKKTGKIREVAMFRMCKFESHYFGPQSKILTINLLSGRVVANSGEVVCDQVDQKDVDLSSACN